VPISLKEELSQRRSDSQDLVHHLFDHIIPMEHAHEILRELLRVGFASVTRAGVKIDATGSVQEEALASALDDTIKLRPENEQFVWTFASTVGRLGTKAEAAQFLNSVTIAALAVAVRLGFVPHKEGRLRLPSTRFTVMPKPGSELPLGQGNQDCRPDLICLRSEAFCIGDQRNPQHHIEKSNAFTTVRQTFPELFEFCTSSPNNATMSAITRSHIDSFNSWYREQEEHNCLDLSHVCWPNIQHAGEVKNTDKNRAVHQVYGYMRQQRRTQPWLRSTIGLVATAGDIGILRADPLGVEQCILKHSTGRGAMEMVRICLGLALASDVDRGYHPCIELETTRTPHPKPSRSGPNSTPEKLSQTHSSKSGSFSGSDTIANTDREEPPQAISWNARVEGHPPVPITADDVFNSKSSQAHTIDFVYPRIRFINLPPDKLHYPKADTSNEIEPSSSTRFYVHHLIYDRGSLVGHSARIFCVSRQVTSDDPEGKEIFEDIAEGVKYIGTFALKLYYASHGTDCFDMDLIAEVRRSKIASVLVPSRSAMLFASWDLFSHYYTGNGDSVELWELSEASTKRM
jgi:hypothetical protein